MGLLTTVEKRVENFAEKKKWHCLHCGKGIENASNLYTRRFCSVACKDAYFSPAKTV